MRNFTRAWILIAVGTLASGHAAAGLSDWLNVLKDSTKVNSGGDTVPGGLDLTQGEIADGLKQALDRGVQHAIQQLGQPGGFLNDARVRIPMPEKLAWIDKSLRKIGKDELADEFIQSMNQAAEQAVPEVATIFGETIQNMSLEDARDILQGADDSATRYFQQHSSVALTERMLPIVRQATDNTGVTSSYKRMMDKAGGLAGLLGQDAVDLDGYVTDRALDGLFLMIAEQEKMIRENPVERSTELLKKVFGSVTAR